MICLNCGHSVEATLKTCPNCMINLQKHGIISEINQDSIAKDRCHNCGTSVKSSEIACSQCNFPLKSKIFKPKTPDNQKISISTKNHTPSESPKFETILMHWLQKRERLNFNYKAS